MGNHQTKSGKPFIIRQPEEKDAEALIAYSKILFASTDQVLTTLEEYTITPEGEKGWIKNFEQNPNALALVADFGEQIIGLLFFIPLNRRKNSHTGEFGVSIHPEYQGIGVGRALIETLITWAIAHHQIEKVFLQVFATNTNAIQLYKKLGFKEEGRHVRAIKQNSGELVDILQMYLETRTS